MPFLSPNQQRQSTEGQLICSCKWVYFVFLYTVALHAESLNESAVLVTWAARGSPPYTVHYWLADAARGQEDVVSVVR